MRHVIIRYVLALIWLAAAVICGISGRVEMAALYLILCGIFLYSACIIWKKEKSGRENE